MGKAGLTYSPHGRDPLMHCAPHLPSITVIESVDSSPIVCAYLHEGGMASRVGSRARRFLCTGHENGSMQIWDLTTALEQHRSGSAAARGRLFGLQHGSGPADCVASCVSVVPPHFFSFRSTADMLLASEDTGGRGNQSDLRVTSMLDSSLNGPPSLSSSNQCVEGGGGLWAEKRGRREITAAVPPFHTCPCITTLQATGIPRQHIRQ